MDQVNSPLSRCTSGATPIINFSKSAVNPGQTWLYLWCKPGISQHTPCLCCRGWTQKAAQDPFLHHYAAASLVKIHIQVGKDFCSTSSFPIQSLPFASEAHPAETVLSLFPASSQAVNFRLSQTSCFSASRALCPPCARRGRHQPCQHQNRPRESTHPGDADLSPSRLSA